MSLETNTASLTQQQLLDLIAQKQSRIDQLVQEVAAGADAEAAQRERIAALEAKLAQRGPNGWPTNEMIEAGRKAADSHGPLLGNGQSLWHVFRDMLSAAPAAPEQHNQSEQHLGMVECRHCGGTGDAPYMTTSPVPYQRTEKCATCDGVGMVAQAPNAQQAEAQEPFGFVWLEDGEWQLGTAFNGGPPLNAKAVFTRPQPAQLQALSEEEVNNVFQRWWRLPATNHRALIKAAESAIAAKNGANLK